MRGMVSIGDVMDTDHVPTLRNGDMLVTTLYQSFRSGACTNDTHANLSLFNQPVYSILNSGRGMWVEVCGDSTAREAGKAR